MTYSVSITYGKKYSFSGFETEQEAQAFAEKYLGNEQRMEKDFDELPYYGSAQDLDFLANYLTVIDHSDQDNETPHPLDNTPQVVR